MNVQYCKQHSVQHTAAWTHRKASAISIQPGWDHERQSTQTTSTMATPPLECTVCAWISHLKTPNPKPHNLSNAFKMTLQKLFLERSNKSSFFMQQMICCE